MNSTRDRSNMSWCVSISGRELENELSDLWPMCLLVCMARSSFLVSSQLMKEYMLTSWNLLHRLVINNHRGYDLAV